ncbi:MAG: Rpn family recombination-promoting nuclease/putative transposase, partial [Myxococcota bacterium]
MVDQSFKVKPHDALFRLVFRRPEHAEGELRHALPEALVARIDWTTLTPVEGSLIDDGLHELMADLVFEVELDGKAAWLYVLVEHQSRAERMMGLRLLRYMGRLWEHWRKSHTGERLLPPIVPLVVYHGPQPWSAPTSFHDLVQLPESALAHLPSFHYL